MIAMQVLRVVLGLLGFGFGRAGSGTGAPPTNTAVSDSEEPQSVERGYFAVFGPDGGVASVVVWDGEYDVRVEMSVTANGIRRAWAPVEKPADIFFVDYPAKAEVQGYFDLV